MILQVPEGFPDGYYEGISLYLWFGTITFFFIAFILFIIKGRKLDLKSQKMLFYGYSMASLGLGFTRVFFLLGVHIPDQYDFFTTLGYLSSLAGLIFWLYILENYLVPKTKKLFTIVSVIAFLVSVVALLSPLPREFALNIQYILLPFSLSAIAVLYIYIIIKTTGDVRVKAIWILIGLVLIAVAQILDGEAFITAYPTFPLVIPPLVMMVGILLYIIPQFK
ncbi:MAG: hypothetical protein ACTSR8_17045 [Promethearchaeota archaeon]